MGFAPISVHFIFQSNSVLENLIPILKFASKAALKVTKPSPPRPSPIAADGGERGAGILSCLGVSISHSHSGEHNPNHRKYVRFEPYAEVRQLENWIRTAEQTKSNIIASLALITHPEMIARAQAKYEAADREIASYQRELQDIKERNTQTLKVAQARPVLEEVIARWDEVEGRERRSLFEAFAHSIHLTRQRRGTKFLTVRWRDRTETTERIELFGHLWKREDIQVLKGMVEANVDQATIMQRFPEDDWGTIQQWYAYHCNHGRFLATYSGEKKYTRATRWTDTEEYQTSQIQASETSS
jgi:hypothetical protein